MMRGAMSMLALTAILLSSVASLPITRSSSAAHTGPEELQDVPGYELQDATATGPGYELQDATATAAEKLQDATATGPGYELQDATAAEYHHESLLYSDHGVNILLVWKTPCRGILTRAHRKLSQFLVYGGMS
jgi:hypothetical protein